MNRLQRELHRLYAASSGGSNDSDLGPADLIDAHGQVRAMVLGLARPADWASLWAVWRGVQSDLSLPAPAIAVCGVDSHQLWFSMAEPVPARQANAFLEALGLRYLGQIKPGRLVMMPTAPAASQRGQDHARPVPALQGANGQWSAFVAADLAPVFDETPWLDGPPNADGQAALLASLRSMPLVDFQRALLQLGAGSGVTPGHTATAVPPLTPTSVNVGISRQAPADPGLDPRRFLLEVMNDSSAPLALRIEAAKALLPPAAPSERG